MKFKNNLFKKCLAFGLATSLAFMTVGCGNTPTATADIETQSEENEIEPIDDNYRVMYEIFTGSFSDSNGDGIGDIQGVINRLDYLQDLGVQGIWLTPIFESPSYHKYDVEDYYTVDGDFGTEEDLETLIDECHKRNMIVIIDLVINHTSRENSWFTKFQMAHQNGNTEDEYYDFYSWTTTDEKQTGITYNKVQNTEDWYECNFSTDMPELNYDNDNVRQAVLDVAKYYLNLGLDGFRFDAIKYIYYGDNEKSAEFWKWYCDELKNIKEDIYMVGECWDSESITLEYTKALNCFNFQASQAEGKIADGVKGNISTFTKYIESYQDKLEAENENAMMINFISNHDMDRAAGYMMLLGNKAEMAANLYLLCSGSPFIYYGEEIGMKGTRGGANTDANRRLAMLWGDEDTVENPIGSDFDETKQINGTVAEQLESDGSLLNYYKKVIAVRNKYPEIARGDYKSVSVSKTVGGFEVSYEDSNLLILHNVDTEEKTIDLTSISGLASAYTELKDYVGMGNASLNGNTLTIGAQTSVILK